MGADSVVITRKQVSVVIPFNAISRIACGSDTHGVANAGQKFAATMLLALQSKTGKAPVEDDIGVRLALESKSGRLPTEATHPPSAGDALVKQVAQPTDSTADSDNAIRNQAPLNAKTPPAAYESGQAAGSPMAPHPQPPVAASSRNSKGKDAIQDPPPKCAQGTYWGDDPSGKAICVWNH